MKYRLPVPGLLLVAVIAFLAFSCIQHKPDRVAKKESPVSAELAEMIADQEVLAFDTIISTEERQRILLTYRERVFKLVAQALIHEPEDLYRAAAILQLADRPDGAESCLLAHYLAKKAVEKGHEKARYMVAVCMDRYLVFSGEPQKYGTQCLVDSLGKWRIYPVNPATSDSERAIWNVDPLVKLKADVASGNVY